MFVLYSYYYYYNTSTYSFKYYLKSILLIIPVVLVVVVGGGNVNDANGPSPPPPPSTTLTTPPSEITTELNNDLNDIIVNLDIVDPNNVDINSATTVSPINNKDDFPFDNTLKCDNNSEQYSTCVNSCPPSCENPERKPCFNYCWNGCECKSGFVRNYRWNCIPKENCPKCGQNEHYRNCGPECEVTCLTYQNVPVYCNKGNCKRGCFCNYGFVRDLKHNGTCIPMDQCPNNCAPNEYLDVNGEPCIRTVDNPRPKCLFEKPIPTCVCNTGFKRDPNTKQCVRIAPLIKCSQNETYSNCGSECARNCFEDNQRFQCPTECNRGCFCNEGYRRDIFTKRCVLPEDCQSHSGTFNTPILFV